MMEDFSGLALPPLFGGHILEAELEPGGVELGPGEVRLMHQSEPSCFLYYKSCKQIFPLLYIAVCTL